MTAGVFEIFKIGVGPSSSHTVGPMLIARSFVSELDTTRVKKIDIDLLGSLAATGRGHATDRAVVLGLAGFHPATIDLEAAEKVLEHVRAEGRVSLNGRMAIDFSWEKNIRFRPHEQLPEHPNAMICAAKSENGEVIEEQIWFSIGGGSIVRQGEVAPAEREERSANRLPYPFSSGEEMLRIAKDAGKSIAEIMLENELAVRPEEEVRAYLDQIWESMDACMYRGCRVHGILPGGLNVKRRAPDVFDELTRKRERLLAEPLAILDWVNLWAMAVNEENAAGGRVVTAPTNGAAGIIPAILRYYERLHKGTREGIHTFLLTAAAIGSLYKKNASISGAEVGCQGEVGVACSMAAAGLTAVLGGSNEQIENAAEIGMEHNLGLTCDPIGGLVQIPCIERNAMGAVKAIDASRLALMNDGTHKVSLDKVIETMRQTGLDMASKYKETSEGGLAVNVTEC